MENISQPIFVQKNKKGKLKQTYDIEPDVFDKLMPSELLQALKISHFKRTEEKELDKIVAELGMTYEDEEEAKKLRKAFPNAEVEWAGKKKNKERESYFWHKNAGFVLCRYHCRDGHHNVSFILKQLENRMEQPP